jgi:trigger factor
MKGELFMKNVQVKEIEIKGADWAKILDEAFQKDVKSVSLAGFRKGNVPKDIYLKKFGIESLYRDAMDLGLQNAYKEVFDKNKDLEPVVEPKIDIKEIDENHIVYTFTIITHPEVTLGAYTNLNIKKETPKVSKEELAAEIKKLQARFAEIVVKDNGEVTDGNTVVIDFNGLVDGKPLEGGKGENYPLEIGSHTFIPGFEEGIIGMKKGETKELNLKFPENYTEDLKNKDVKFTVKVEEIKERVLPELNQDFYEDLGYKDIKTEEEFKNKVESEIKVRKDKELEDKYINDCLDKAVSNMKVEINPEIIHEEVHLMLHQFEEQIKMQGITLDQYMAYSGMKMADFEKQMEPEATKRVQSRFLLEAIANKEKYDFTDAEVDKKAEELAKEYGVTKEELIKEFGGVEVVKYDMKMRKAIETVKANKETKSK